MYPIEPISKRHHYHSFHCGKAELDDYLRRFAHQNDEKNIAKTFVAVNPDGDVLAYYSLSTASIVIDALPDELRQALPAYPVPAVLIARLAVDRSMKGQGLGAHLLIDALHRIVRAAEEIAVKVIMVDAKDEEARSFYRHYGFMQLPQQNLRLFLPIETVHQLFYP